MPEISFTGAFNAATAIVPDLYINAQPPGAAAIQPALFGIIGINGVASWGPVNKPTNWTPNSILFGAAVVRSFDAMTAATVVANAQQAAGLGAQIIVNRVTDGTDTAAAASIGSVAASTETATVAGTLTIGDGLQITFTSSGITGSPVTVTYTTKAGDTTASMAAGLAAAVNANAALVAASVSATAAASVATIKYPTATTITFGHNVTGGATETITLAAGSATTIFGVELTSKYTGSAGNNITYALAAGSNSTSGTPTWRMTLQMPNFASEVFDNIGGTGNALWVNIVSAINNGNSIIRGPSNLVIATGDNSSQAAAAASGSLSGGSDGPNVTSANLVGNNAVPFTGIYAFQAVQGVSDLLIPDFDDETQDANLIAFGQGYGIVCHSNGPPGEAVATAVTAKQTAGSYNRFFRRWVGDWCYWNDNLNGVQRLLGPSTFGVAVMSQQQPQNSGLNNPAPGVVATQRSQTQMPYSSLELAQLKQTGIDVIANPCPGGNFFGIRLGVSAIASPTEGDDRWPRLTSWLAYSLSSPAALGTFIGQNITPSFFAQGYALLDNFFNLLANPSNGSTGMIQAFQIQFSPANNPQSQTALGIVVAAVWVQYFGIAQIFLVNMQSGETVVLPASTNAQTAASQITSAISSAFSAG